MKTPRDLIVCVTPTQGRYAGQECYCVLLPRAECKFFDTMKEAEAFASDYLAGHIRPGKARGFNRALRGASLRYEAGLTYIWPADGPRWKGEE